MSAGLGELRGLLWSSRVLYAAALDRAGRVVEANDALREAAGRDLEGEPVSALVAEPQRRVLDAHVRDAGPEWACVTLGFWRGGPVAADDRLVHVRRDGDAVLLVAEPDGAQRDRLVEQVLQLNDDLIASQRETGRRERQVARAQAEAAVAADRVRQLEAVALAGFTTSSLDAALQRLLRLARETLDSEGAAVMLLDEDRRRLHTRAVVGMDESAYFSIGVDEGLATAVLDGDGLVVNDIRQADVRTPYLRRVGGSVLATPLRLDGADIGLLYVSSLRTERFTQEDLRLLRAVGERAALAIGHAQLRDRERRIAETLQRSLLPQALPDPPGLRLTARYLPRGGGGPVGGDFYDAVVRPDGRVVLAIGDIAGKGLRAASSMGQVRAALHAYVLEHDSPAAVLDRLDRFVAAADITATAQVVVVDADGGRAVHASAGHPPAVVGGRLLGGGLGPPLGVERAGRVEDEAPLEPGARIVLYTDGLVERRDTTLEAGLDALAAACRASGRPLEQLCDEVLEALLPADGAWPDDVALLAAERIAR